MPPNLFFIAGAAVVLTEMFVADRMEGIIGVLFAGPGIVVLNILVQELRAALASEGIRLPAEDTTPERRTQPEARAP